MRHFPLLLLVISSLLPFALEGQRQLVLLNEHGLQILKAEENTAVMVVDKNGARYQDYLRIINDDHIMLQYHLIHVDSIAKIKRVGISSIGGLVMALGVTEIAMGAACLNNYDNDKTSTYGGISLAMGVIFTSLGGITEVAGWHFAAFRTVDKGRKLLIEKT